jgi:urease accessory protein
MRTILLALIALGLTTVQAFAHHALGGTAPIGFGAGLLSGLAHPIINFDHFAFVVAIGILTAVAQGSALLPVLFVLGTVIGCVASAQGLQVPNVTMLIPISVAIAGAALALGRDRVGWMDPGFLALAGLLHGLAYAQSIIGGQNNSLAGYLIGFAVVQSIIALAAMWCAYTFWCGDRLYANARVAGGVIAGIGLTLLAQSGLSTVLPVMAQ